MPEIPPDLVGAVREQADARLEMNIAVYAKFLTPEAVDSLRASFPGIQPRVARYQYELYERRGDDYIVDVRYFARHDSFVVRSRWRRESACWRVVHSERLWAEGERFPGPLARLAASVLRVFSRLRRPGG